METTLGQQTTDKIMQDLKKLVDNEKKGKILLKDYIPASKDKGCMDFAMIYEMSDDLQSFVKQKKMEGINIQINEDNIAII